MLFYTIFNCEKIKQNILATRSSTNHSQKRRSKQLDMPSLLRLCFSNNHPLKKYRFVIVFGLHQMTIPRNRIFSQLDHTKLDYEQQIRFIASEVADRFGGPISKGQSKTQINYEMDLVEIKDRFFLILRILNISNSNLVYFLSLIFIKYYLILKIQTYLFLFSNNECKTNKTRLVTHIMSMNHKS